MELMTFAQVIWLERTSGRKLGLTRLTSGREGHCRVDESTIGKNIIIYVEGDLLK